MNSLLNVSYPRLARAKRNAAAHQLAVVYQPPMGNTGGDAAYINSSSGGHGNQVKTYVDNGKYMMKPRSGNLPSLHSPRNYRQVRTKIPRGILILLLSITKILLIAVGTSRLCVLLQIWAR